MAMLIALFAIFGNLWIWKIFSVDILSFSVALLVCHFLINAYKSNSKKLNYAALFSIALLLLLQFRNTEPRKLTELTNDDIRLRDERLSEYPPINFPLAHWLEGRVETVAARRIHTSLFEELDINTYFFAGHPRGRVGVDEFEKYSYILMPLILIGFARVLSKNIIIFGSAIFVLLATSIYGTSKSLGTLALFPLFTLSLIEGVTWALQLIKQGKSAK